MFNGARNLHDARLKLDEVYIYLYYIRKKMKFLPYFLIFGFIVIFNQCKKPEEYKNSTDPISEINVPEGFDWKMSHPVNFHITGTENQVIKISSADGSTIYHKSKIAEGESVRDFRLTLPDFINEVLINGTLVTITGSDITFTLPLKKDITVANYNLVFDGVNDYVDMGDPVSGDLDFGTGDFTCEAWVSTTDVTQDVSFRRIFSKGNEWSCFVRPTGRVDVYYNSTSLTVPTLGHINGGTFHHVAVVRAGSNISIFIDGVPDVDETKAAFGNNLNSSEDFRIGQMKVGATENGHWHGKIDEVRVWNCARTLSEISDNYDKTVSPTAANLQGYWRFDEGTGSTAYDNTLFGNHGTISGCTWNQEPNGFDSDSDGVDDEDDDYPLDATRAFNNYYPVAGTGTLAFEDLWPFCGDYDFNDLILDYRFKTVSNASDDVVEVIGTFTVRANGAALYNGFGFVLPDADSDIPDNIEVTGYSLTHGIITLDGMNHLEAGQTKPVVIVFDDAYDLMPGISNTVLGGAYHDPVSIDITMTVTNGFYFREDDFGLDSWNPFLFIELTRGREVHLMDYPPTDLVNPDLFGTGSDASDPGTSTYYHTSTGLPWAMDFPISYEYTVEYQPPSMGYLHFIEWVESGGTTYTDWYSNAGAGYRDNTYIYTP